MNDGHAALCSSPESAGGSDSIASTGLSGFHDGDVYVPVDPAGLPTRLEPAGFTDVEVSVPGPEWFTFQARA